MIEWNPTDVLEFFGTDPQIDEYETGYHYSIDKNGLHLEFSVFPLAGDVAVTINRQGGAIPVVDLKVLGSQMLKRVNDKSGNFLEITPGIVFGGRFDTETTIPYGFRLLIDPEIGIQLFKK